MPSLLKTCVTFFSSRMSLKRMRTCGGKVEHYSLTADGASAPPCDSLPCVESAELNPSATNLKGREKVELTTVKYVYKI